MAIAPLRRPLAIALDVGGTFAARPRLLCFAGDGAVGSNVKTIAASNPVGVPTVNRSASFAGSNLGLAESANGSITVGPAGGSPFGSWTSTPNAARAQARPVSAWSTLP